MANSLILYKATLNHALFELKENRNTWMAKWENSWTVYLNMLKLPAVVVVLDSVIN